MAQKFVWVFPYFFNVLFDPLFLKAVTLAVLALRCWVWSWSRCCERGLLASCCARASHCGGFFCWEHGLSPHSSCTWLPRGTWNLSWSGIEPVPPALTGRSPTTRPPGKSGFAHNTVQKTRGNLLANPIVCLFPHLHCLLQLDPKHQKGRHCCVLLCMLRAKQRVGSYWVFAEWILQWVKH